MRRHFDLDRRKLKDVTVPAAIAEKSFAIHKFEAKVVVEKMEQFPRDEKVVADIAHSHGVVRRSFKKVEAQANCDVRAPKKRDERAQKRFDFGASVGSDGDERPGIMGVGKPAKRAVQIGIRLASQGLKQSVDLVRIGEKPFLYRGLVFRRQQKPGAKPLAFEENNVLLPLATQRNPFFSV